MSWSLGLGGAVGSPVAMQVGDDAFEGAHLVGPARQGGRGHHLCDSSSTVEVVGCRSSKSARSCASVKPELLGGVAVGAVRTGAVVVVPARMACATAARQLEIEELVDRSDGAHRVGDELAVVHVEEAVLADASLGPRSRSPRPTRRCSAASWPEPVQVALAVPAAGRSPTRCSPTTAPPSTGSRCVMTKRTSGYAATIASRWKLWCGALNSHRSGGPARLEELHDPAVVARRSRSCRRARHHAW